MYKRFIEARLRIALKDTPAIFIGGPRQSGKTTLAKKVAGRQTAYVTLDDATTRAAAAADPIGFIRNLDRCVIDEVQREPNLLLAIKQSIDNDRRPGRFILTGSANILTIPRASESLAGRMETFTLYPLSRAEILGHKPSFIDAAFAGEVPPLRERLSGGDLISLLTTGGYPEAIARRTDDRRRDWLRAYITSIVSRDIRDIDSIHHVEEMPRLLRVLAEYASQLVNIAEIGTKIRLDHKTLQRYIGLLENVFAVARLQPWFSNKLKRLVKTPKLHFLDSGLLATTRGLTAKSLGLNRNAMGPLLETFVMSEIKKQIGWNATAFDLYHFRDREQREVDFVIENEIGEIVAVEVKASATVQDKDFKNLRHIAEVTGRKFRFGVVLHDGERTLPFGDKLVATPLSSLWS